MTTQNVERAIARDLAAAAKQARVFGTFLRAAESAGLMDTFRRGGPFTVFAPTDKAFEKVPAATMDKLMLPEHEDVLRAVLSFHFAPGQVRAARFSGARIRATSFEGSKLMINGSDGITVCGARVVAPDIAASNGVIHGIDGVLWPKRASFKDQAPQPAN